MGDGLERRERLEVIYDMVCEEVLKALKNLRDSNEVISPTMLTSVRQFLGDQGFSADLETSQKGRDILQLLPPELVEDEDVKAAFGD